MEALLLTEAYEVKLFLFLPESWHYGENVYTALRGHLKYNLPDVHELFIEYLTELHCIRTVDDSAVLPLARIEHDACGDEALLIVVGYPDLKWCFFVKLC